MADEVLRPIGVRHAPMMHTREPGGSDGLAVMGVGLYPTSDDVAKIAGLFQAGGQHGGRQLLHRALVMEALYRGPALAGLPARRVPGTGDAPLYHLSFWSSPWREGGCFLQVPHMEGFGGNLVVLLPNQVTAFRFADASDYDPYPLIQAGNAVRALCPQG